MNTTKCNKAWAMWIILWMLCTFHRLVISHQYPLTRPMNTIWITKGSPRIREINSSWKLDILQHYEEAMGLMMRHSLGSSPAFTSALTSVPKTTSALQPIIDHSRCLGIIFYRITHKTSHHSPMKAKCGTLFASLNSNQWHIFFSLYAKLYYNGALCVKDLQYYALPF